MRIGSAVYRLSVLLVVLAAATAGCKKAQVVEAPDYSRPLPPGQSALRRIVDIAQLPDLTMAFEGRDAELLAALTRSIAWFDKPSTRQFFPALGAPVSHEHAQASVFAFRQILATSASASEFQSNIYNEFDCYISVGWNNNGVVLFTGYYTPGFTASAVRTEEYRYPLYGRPADLVTEPATGRVLGRRVGSQIVPYPSRAQIEASNLLAGNELVYMKDKFDAYIVQVNGSAKLTLTDGRVMFVGYAGNNGHEYTSIGKLLVADGKMDKNRVSLATLRQYFREHPAELDLYINRNARYVFFKEYAGDNWPAGSLGFKVEPMRTLATDKEVFPRGGVVLVATHTADPAPLGASAVTAMTQRFEQFMLDQDTGGAIRAPGRADIYMGQGDRAESLAGRQFAEGQLYYFFLKPQRVQWWQSQMKAVRQRDPAVSRAVFD